DRDNLSFAGQGREHGRTETRLVIARTPRRRAILEMIGQQRRAVRHPAANDDQLVVNQWRRRFSKRKIREGVFLENIAGPKQFAGSGVEAIEDTRTPECVYTAIGESRCSTWAIAAKGFTEADLIRMRP